jgi:hypothetical protein
MLWGEFYFGLAKPSALREAEIPATAVSLKKRFGLKNNTRHRTYVAAAFFNLVRCCCFGGGAYQHCNHESLLYSNPPPMEFRHSSPEALHTKRRERPLLAKDGTKSK